jgi:hypothetical protein
LRFFILQVRTATLHGYESPEQVATYNWSGNLRRKSLPVLKEFRTRAWYITCPGCLRTRGKLYTLTQKWGSLEVASLAWGEVADYILKAIR